MSSIDKIELREHESSEPLDGSLYKDLVRLLNHKDYDPNNPNCLLGLDWAERCQTSVKASYFIGLKWIEEGKSFVQVNPKIKNLDFIQMFMTCFDSANTKLISKFKEIYQIDFNAKPIETKVSDTILTPLLIVHFLKKAERVLHQRLKYDYEVKEEVLNKVKGRILLTETISRLHATGRLDLNKCVYQDYSINTLENQIVKKTLHFVAKYLNTQEGLSCSDDLLRITNACLSCLTGVDDNIPLGKLRQFRINPLFRDYKDLLELAMYILKRFAYSLEEVNAESDKLVPPYWIDMSLLFELYVYQRLQETYGRKIDYHLSTYGNEIDFVKYDEYLIIDAKYSLYWAAEIQHEHIRQLSGYARNVALRRKVMGVDYDEETILNCLFIYPSCEGGENFLPNQRLLANSIKIEPYLRFYKMPLTLPMKKQA